MTRPNFKIVPWDKFWCATCQSERPRTERRMVNKRAVCQPCIDLRKEKRRAQLLP